MKLPALATRLLISAAISSISFPITACAGNPPPNTSDATPEPQAVPETPAQSVQDSAQAQKAQAQQVQQQAQQYKDKDKQQKAIRDMQMAIERDRRSLDEAAKNMDPSNPFFLAANDRPTLLITQPIDGRSIEEWSEDLKIMDKLLRNAITHAGDDDVPTAMGIKLTTFGRVPPTYIEDAGVLFTLGVNFPLASSPNIDGKSAQPPEQESAWDRAKRELDNPKGASPRPEPRAPLTFDQSKVDNLLTALLNTLPQAANFRHLNDGEFVMITITSIDTARNPLRLTLKAKKIDINQAYNKSLNPDDFKKRVAWHIG